MADQPQEETKPPPEQEPDKVIETKGGQRVEVYHFPKVL
jgi:hypothetical protein